MEGGIIRYRDRGIERAKESEGERERESLKKERELWQIFPIPIPARTGSVVISFGKPPPVSSASHPIPRVFPSAPSLCQSTHPMTLHLG